MRERGSGTREVIETTLEAAGLPARDLHIAMELNSTEAILGCIESGVGVGFVSRTPSIASSRWVRWSSYR